MDGFFRGEGYGASLETWCEVRGDVEVIFEIGRGFV